MAAPQAVPRDTVGVVQGLVIILVLFALFWLFLIRPQRRRQAEQNALIRNVEVGDEIVTAGGLFGHVQGVADDELLVEIAPGTNVRIARRAVAGIVGPEDEEDEEPGEELEAGEEPEPEHEAAAEETPR
jgi:preprotein translocase subunit YajC